MAPSSELNAEVPSWAMCQRVAQRETDSDLMGAPLGMKRQICLPAHTLTSLVFSKTIHKEVCSSVSDRICSTICPGEFKTSNYCHVYYGRDLLLLLPYKPEYNSIFEVHISILSLLQFLELLTLLSNAWSIRNISWLSKILLESSFITDLLIFFMKPLSSIYSECCFQW